MSAPKEDLLAYEFGPYRLDAVGRSLRCGPQAIALPPKAVDVLAELVKRPGEVVGKEALMTTVWPETFVEEANLNQMVFLLRRAFGAKNGSEYIQTVPRRGYLIGIGSRQTRRRCVRSNSHRAIPMSTGSVEFF